MKNALVQLILVIIGVSGIHAVRLLQTSSFHVRLSPGDGAAQKIWAIQGKDSLEMINVNGDYYIDNIKPGNWIISVEANAPYKSAQYEVSDLKPGVDRELGEIRLKNR